jgi:hypothetical protein
VIAVTFGCGHVVQLSGNEQHPRCACGNDRLASVKARAPKFHGFALGPCAKFEELPAKAVTFKGDK